MLDEEGVLDTGRLDGVIECRCDITADGRPLVGVVVKTGILEADVARKILDLLAVLLPLPLKPTDGLEETPEALEPLGFRLRAPAAVSAWADPLRGSVLDAPGRLKVARWKLGVRRTPVGVLTCPLPSQLSSDCKEPCFESVLRLGGRLPEWLPPEFIARAGADGLRSCKRNDTSPSLTELSGVPPENDDRIGVLRTVFSRTISSTAAAICWYRLSFELENKEALQ